MLKRIPEPFRMKMVEAIRQTDAPYRSAGLEFEYEPPVLRHFMARFRWMRAW